MEKFSDPLDQAVAEQERALQQSLVEARKVAVVLPFKGVCYNCDEPQQPGHRFCDQDCRDDYEQRVRSRSVNGLKV